jgi:hypothetical protein
MIYLKLRQAGQMVNYNRVERLYHEANLQVRRRKRKNVPPADRQPLLRPATANEVWSIVSSSTEPPRGRPEVPDDRR